jgi:OmpA-OmpF porin, OOP family
MSCNWWRWLWGIIPLLVLSWVAVQAEQGRVEADLRTRATLALVQGGMSWASAHFVGRDAIVRGLTSDEAEPRKAGEVLQGVWGVRVVDNGIELAPLAEKYTWTAGRRGNRIRINGHVPNRATRKAILGVAKANFPGFEVIDRMAPTRGVPSADTWLGGVGFALKQLGNLKRGDVRLEGLGLRIAGEAEDVAAYRAVKSALADDLPKGISLTNDLVTAPVVSPFTWSAQFTDGQLVLLGYAPGEAVHAELLKIAAASVASGAVVDKMQPGEGAPQGFNSAAVASIRQVARLLGGAAELKDGVLVVSGQAGDAATAEAVRAALRAALPATIKLVDHIKIKEPPPPAPPVIETPPPPAKEMEAPDKPQAGAALPAAPTQMPATKDDRSPPASPPAPSRGETGSVTPAVPAREAEVQAKTCEDRLQGLVKEGQIAFEVASADLDSASLPTLDRLAAAAKSCPGVQIEIGGHASSEGSQAVNQQLSIRRANSVVAYLIRAGVDATQLQSVGYGASRPVAPNDSNENMAKNRRIEFAVRPK